MTAVGATSAGFVTVYPCGEPIPKASNLNVGAGQTTPNLVVSKVGAGGAVCIYTQSGADFVADVTGYFLA